MQKNCRSLETTPTGDKKSKIMYLLQKIVIAFIFSLTGVKVLNNIEKVDNANGALQFMATDYLLILLVVLGLTFSLLHEFFDTKRAYPFNAILVVLSIAITTALVLVVGVFYFTGNIGMEIYYALTLFVSVFGSSLSRYLVKKLPERWGEAIIKAGENQINKNKKDE